MQCPINDEIHFEQTVDPADNTLKVKSVNFCHILTISLKK